MFKESGLSCLNFFLGLVKEGQILDIIGRLQMQQSIISDKQPTSLKHIFFKEIKISQKNVFNYFSGI